MRGSMEKKRGRVIVCVCNVRVMTTLLLQLFCFVLRCVEVALCMRKSCSKTHSFPTKPSHEYYHSVEKWKQPLA